MKIKSIIMLIILGLFIIVAIQNSEDVQMHTLFWSFNISKFLMLIITLVIGMFIGILIPGLLRKSNKKKEEKIEEQK